MSGAEQPPANDVDNVVLEARVRFTAHFSEEYANLAHIKFRFNEGTWCGDGLIDDLQKFARANGCACDMVVGVDVISINGVALGDEGKGER